MNLQFDFTNIVPVEIVKEVKKKGIVATPKNPEGLRLRIFKDGSVFPSQELTAMFKLEYVNKGVEESVNGFDIWSSKDWGQYPKEAQQFIFIAAVPKSEAKVSVFGSVDYNADGTPINSVLTQGAKRPDLVKMLREVYGKHVVTYATNEEMTEFDTMDSLFLDKNYVDLDVNVNVEVFKGLAKVYVPKQFVKGAKAGQMTYEERTNLNIFPLTITQVVEEKEVEQVEENN